MNRLKKTDPLLTESKRPLISPRHTYREPEEHPQQSTKPCGKLHLRPTETDLDLNQTVREIAIHWTLARQSPEQVGATLNRYAALLKDEDGQPPSLFKQVLLEMISEQQKQGDSHDM